MRRFWAGALSISTSIVALLAGPSPADASSIYDFRIYGTNSVMLGINSQVLSGKVGSDTAVNTNAGSGITFADDVLSGGEVHFMGDNFVLGRLVATDLVRIGDGGTDIAGSIDADVVNFTNAGGQDGVTVGGTVTYGTSIVAPQNCPACSISQGIPLAPDLPTFPSATPFSAGGPDIHDPINPIPPGVYGLIESSLNNRDLRFSSGDYFIDSISLTGQAQMEFDVTNGPVRLFIVDDATLAASKDVTVVGGDDSDVYVEIHGDWTHGGGGTWHGTIFAPNGLIHIGSGSGPFTFNGYMWGKDVDVEHTVTIGGRLLPEPSTLATFASTLLLMSWTRRPPRAFAHDLG